MGVNYIVNTYRYDQLKNNVVLPKFQRSLVWNKERKENFIKTVMEKNPFGVLLIYKNPANHKQQIIDGLQRFTTLNDFEKNPLEYLKFEFSQSKSFNQIIKFILDEYKSSTHEYVKNQLRLFIEHIFKKHSTNDLNRDRLFNSLLRKAIFDVYPQIRETASGLLIVEEISSLWEEIKRKITIDDIEIPVIVYQGPAEELPNIFERLNTGGTSLTKYEVFASTWSETILKNVNLEIAKIIEKRFSEIIKKTGMQVDNYSEGDIITSREITLYEYCFALGKLIKTKAPELFGGKKSRKFDSVDSIGFSTLISFLNMHLKDMNKLNEIINEKIDFNKLNKWTSTIISTYKDLNEIIKRYVANNNKYVEAQIISMAHTLYNIKYHFDPETFTITPKKQYFDLLNKFQKYAPYRMFYDIIRNYWAGSGDNKLYEIIQLGLEKNRYLMAIDKSQYQLSVSDWLQEQLDKTNKTVNKETKMFLSFVYYKSIHHLEQYKLANIVPKNYLTNKQIIEAVNHPGNLYWVTNGNVSQNKHVLQTEQKDNRSLDPDPNALEWLDLDDIKDAYKSYIIERSSLLIKAFIDAMPW